MTKLRTAASGHRATDLARPPATSVCETFIHLLFTESCFTFLIDDTFLPIIDDSPPSPRAASFILRVGLSFVDVSLFNSGEFFHLFHDKTLDGR